MTDDAISRIVKIGSADSILLLSYPTTCQKKFLQSPLKSPQDDQVKVISSNLKKHRID
jgi:hypothetical protein